MEGHLKLKPLTIYMPRLEATSPERRTVTGRILPFGEPGQTSAGAVTVTAGAVTLPADPADCSLNLEHDYRAPIGYATNFETRKDGIWATFQIIETTAGNDYLAEAAAGLRRGLSVEIDSPAITAGRLTAGQLTAVAAVVRPAYPSAGVTKLAAAITADPGAEIRTEEYTATTETIINPDGTGESTTEITITETIEDQEDKDPQEDEEKDTPMTETIAAARPAGLHKTKTAPVEKNFKDTIRLMARAYNTRDTGLLADLGQTMAQASQLFAALTDVPFDSAGAAGGVMTQPAWINELWQIRGYERKIIPLISAGDLTAMKMVGWRWKTKPTMGPWAGNKAAVPSSTAETEAIEKTAMRLAGAHDIAREYRDFDMPDFWEGYFKAMAESYALQSDQACLAELITEATEVTPGSTPTGVPEALVNIVDCALSFMDTATPSFAIVATNLWRDLMLTPRDHTVEYLSSSLGLEEGQLAGFKIIPASQMPVGSTLVGAKAAATAYELPGSPIRVEGLDIARGGIDIGLFGYLCTMVHDNRALAFVGTKPTPPTP